MIQIDNRMVTDSEWEMPVERFYSGNWIKED